jgi:hypothetical protein
MPWPGFCHSGEHAKQSTLLEVQQSVEALQVSVSEIATKIGKIMSQDASILAVAQGIEANDQNLAAALVTIQTAVAALLAEVAAGGTTAISDSTMAALTQAKTDFDAALATAEQNASDDTTAATPPAPTS